MKRTLTVVLSLLLCFAMIMVVSCNKGSSSSSGSAASSKAAAKEKVKIQIMVGFGTGTDPSQISVHEQLQNEFNNTIGKEKGIEVEFLTVPYADAATKFSYEDVLAQFEHLKQTNKNFLYAVLPAFKDNVNVRDIENYMQENGISRMLIMDLKLRFMNRNEIFIKKSDISK